MLIFSMLLLISGNCKLALVIIFILLESLCERALLLPGICLEAPLLLESSVPTPIAAATAILISCSGECVAAADISQVLDIAILFVVETLLSLSGMLLAWLAWLWWCAEAPLDGAPAFAEELPLPLLRLCRSFSEGEMGPGELSTSDLTVDTLCGVLGLFGLFSSILPGPL